MKLHDEDEEQDGAEPDPGKALQKGMAGPFPPKGLQQELDAQPP